MKIHLATKLMAATFAIALVAVPAFATNQESSMDFHALGQVAADVQTAPTVLTDEQLASVEGGDHLTTGIAYLIIARVLADVPGNAWDPLANAFAAAGVFTASGPVHGCGVVSQC
jgi:hypothetical protein